MKRAIFIDESGIGRKVGHSVYCLTSCHVSFKKDIDEAVEKIEQNLRIMTFHWREQSWQIKKKFLRKTLKIEGWSCTICIIDNKTHPYESAEEVIAQGLLGQEVKVLYVDGKKTRKYTYSVKAALKKLGLLVGTLKMVPSSSCGGLRISDAVAGLIRLSLETKLDKEVAEILEEVNKKITTQVVSGHLPNPPHGR